MIVESSFKPARGFANRHLQTLLPMTPLLRIPAPATRREVLTLPDGDSLALDWLDQEVEGTQPTLLILHGLEGSSDSSYARCLLDGARARGWRALVMHFRDCGDHRNVLPRRYHAGETGDMDVCMRELRKRFGQSPLFVAGFSLGGNALLKYLGESGSAALCDRAVAVSVPFSLQASSDALSKGISRLYQWHLMGNMKRSLARKFANKSAPIDLVAAANARDFETFDNLVTAPLHGFANKDDYYARCSSAQFLPKIATPTLILQAKDDPFMSEDIVPGEQALSAQVTLETSERGGHVGFIEGRWPWRLDFWLPKRIFAELEQHRQAEGNAAAA